MSILKWKKSNEELPIIGADVIGYNEDNGLMEFGFRSSVDKHFKLWCDFSFPITHWAYANPPEDTL